MGQASSQTSLGGCSVVNCHGPHCTEWSLATCSRLATTTRSDVACFVDAAVASSAKARAGDNAAQDDWFCRRTPSGRSFWHHMSFEPPQPWQECAPADNACGERENHDTETRKEYVVKRFVGFDEEALAEQSTKDEEYAIHESYEKDLAKTNELNKEIQSHCLYASGAPKLSPDQVMELYTEATNLSSLHDMKLRIESQNLEPAFDLQLAGAGMAATEETGAAVNDSTRTEVNLPVVSKRVDGDERRESKASADDVPEPKQQEAVAKRPQQRQEKKPRPKPKAFSAPAGDKKLHHISIANLRAPGSSTKPAAANPRLKVEDVLVW